MGILSASYAEFLILLHELSAAFQAKGIFYKGKAFFTFRAEAEALSFTQRKHAVTPRASVGIQKGKTFLPDLFYNFLRSRK